MAKKVFMDYMAVNEKLLEGFTVAEVLTGINAEDSGIMLELERQVDNVIIGIDMFYNPEFEEGETPFMISEEYVKDIIQVPEELEKGIKITSALENNNRSWPTINVQR